MWFFKSLKRKVEEDNLPHYVADKTVFDMGARWFAHMPKGGATEEQHEEVIRAMRECAEKSIYDRIIYLPLDFSRSVADDGLRTTEQYLRYKRDLLLKGALSQFGVSVETYDFKFTDSPEKVLNDLGLNQVKR